MSAPLGPFCQSCSMPLRSPDDFGTDEAGYRINDYCRHCFVHGAFTEPAITMEQMLERCVTVMSEEHIMPAAEARALMEETLPRLKRWSHERSRPLAEQHGGPKQWLGF